MISTGTPGLCLDNPILNKDHAALNTYISAFYVVDVQEILGE